MGIDTAHSPGVLEAGHLESRSRHVLDSEGARKLVGDYGVPVSPWRIVSDPDAALAAADAVGYPVVIKSAAADVVHKSDLGCVRIGIEGPDALHAAFSEVAANARGAGSVTPEQMLVERMAKGAAEIVVGLKRSPTFGPTILVGMGGVWVELMKDFALRLCPIDDAEAREMLRELRGFPVLDGMRGRPPCDVAALVSVIAAVSRLGAERDDLMELDLNPVMVMEDGRGAVAVDVRVVVAGTAQAMADNRVPAQEESTAR